MQHRIAPVAPQDIDPRWRSARAYLTLGALLGFGAPLGFLALERLRPGGRAGRLWLAEAMSDGGLALAYMAVSTPVVFGLFGRTLGRHEEELRASSRHVERLREEFAAVVAHDLRNPIHAILLQVEALLRGACDGEVTVSVSTLARLKRGAERLSHMVNDLLDATRIEAARLSLLLQTVSLSESVTALLERIEPTLGNHPVDLHIEGAPLLVQADPVRLDQIFTNVVENAAKYSDEGRPISIHVRPAGAGAVVSVKDRGYGIAPEDVPRLFDRFYQAKRAREKKSGLGLGLFITKGLVEAHGGRIDVQTAPGRGSVFSVWLPRAAPL